MVHQRVGEEVHEDDVEGGGEGGEGEEVLTGEGGEGGETASAHTRAHRVQASEKLRA